MFTFRLRKRLGSFGLDVELESLSSRLVLFGPSGSGKSVTLQCISGLLRPDEGLVQVNERVLFDERRRIDLPPEKRRIGYVPQSYALFPHLTVAENVGFGLRHATPQERRSRVSELLELVRLPGYETRRPDQLSGGEQQRVSLARALAPAPSLLLLDEPFSALDAPVRAALRQELLELQARLGFSWVFVTHDPEEAFLLAEEIGVYQAGKVLQIGPRDDVFYRPDSVAAAQLVGMANIFSAMPDGPQSVQIDDTNLRLSVSSLTAHHSAVGTRVWACVRAEDVRILRKGRPMPDPNEGTTFTGTIVQQRQLGFTQSLRFEIGDGRTASLWVDLPLQAYRTLGIDRENRWQLVIPSSAVHIIPTS